MPDIQSLIFLREASQSLRKSTKHAQGALKTATQESDRHKAALTNASVEVRSSLTHLVRRAHVLSLHIQADATINQAIVAANAVLHRGRGYISCAPSCQSNVSNSKFPQVSGSTSSKQFRHRFADLTERHSHVVTIAENGASELHRMTAAIPFHVELDDEGSRLEEAFHSLTLVNGKARNRLGEAAYCEHLA